jgi:hypothetical protein
VRRLQSPEKNPEVPMNIPPFPEVADPEVAERIPTLETAKKP